MKTTMMKKVVFSASFLAIPLFFLLGRTVPSLCGLYNYTCQDKFEIVFRLLLVFLPLLLLSLITYKMRDEVFRAWWNFARWWVPVIILVTYLQSTQSGGGGLGIGGAISSGFDMLILGFFYAVLVIVSLWRIVRKYRQLKRETKQG